MTQSRPPAMVAVMALALTGFAPLATAGDMAEQTTVNAHSDREAKLTTPV